MAQLILPPELTDPRRSTRKLSEVAKRLAIPRDIIGTDWPYIRDICRDDLGIEFDTWQDGLGQYALAQTPRDRLAHTVGGFHLSAPRQCGKTHWGTGTFFGLCQKYPGLKLIWSSHHGKTTAETFLAMQGFARRPRIAPFIGKVYTGSGDEAIYFRNGSEILFGARESGFPRGIPGVDGMFNDEAQIMSQKAMEAGLATMNTSWLGLHIYAGTPPRREELHKAEVWMRKREEAWTIEDKSIITVDTEDMFWCEIGGDDDADLDDVYQWARNPSFPHRTSIESIQRLRRNLTDSGFLHEGLGAYDSDEGSVFDLAMWKTLTRPNAPEIERAALVVDVSPDRRWSSIGICGEFDEEADLVMVLSVKDTGGLAQTVKQLDDERILVDIAITPGAARAIETELTKLGVNYDVMTSSEVAAAYANMQEAIKNSAVVHVGQPELDFAMTNSKSRHLQTGESESFDRREYSLDVSPAVAAAGALYRWGLANDAMPFLG